MSTILETAATTIATITPPAGLGAAFVVLINRVAKYLESRTFEKRVKKAARDAGEMVPEGPKGGTLGWLWRQMDRANGQRHAYERIVNRLAERVAKLEGERDGRRQESGEQERIAFDRERYPENPENDTDPIPPPLDEPRARESRPDLRRAARRSRPG